MFSLKERYLVFSNLKEGGEISNPQNLGGRIAQDFRNIIPHGTMGFMGESKLSEKYNITLSIIQILSIGK